MTVYGIAQFNVSDRATYDRYANAFMPILRQYGGSLLVAEDEAEVIEGSWDSHRVVVLAFADKASFETWYNSPEYQAIIGDRLAAAHGPVLLTRGIPQEA
jgi:uncharacterized protein (DUF1330 family)